MSRNENEDEAGTDDSQAEDGTSVQLIDDQGNLFGIVNVVDALVVLIVLAVVAAGVSLIMAGGIGSDSEPAPQLKTTYATLDLGSQSPEVIAALDEGDTHTPDGSPGNVTITDIYSTPREGSAPVIARVKVDGLVNDGQITYKDAPLRINRSLRITTDRYKISGNIQTVGNGSTLTIEESTRNVTLRMSGVRDSVADRYRAGMTEEIRGETIGEITTVAVKPTTILTTSETGEPQAMDHPFNRTVTMTAELSVRETQSGLTYKGNRLREGATITLDLGTKRPTVTVTQIR
jgi:hypothetical protein